MSILYIFLGVYLLAMLFVSLYSFAQAHLLYHFLIFRRKKRIDPFLDIDNLPYVTVQLPIFNEKYVVKRLIKSCAQFNYPKDKLQIQLLDDSTDETAAIIQQELSQYPDINFQYLHRSDRKGFKAGALREGMEKATGEYIAVFDADFLPDPDFIIKTIGHFEDPKVGMVQSRWTHLNENYSVLTRLQAFALDAHFMVEQIGRNQQQAFINFNGTGGIWRKTCILDAGNWEDDTLTEDLDLSYRAQQKGWKFVYRPDISSPAELPPVMSAIKSQQFRWTKGGAECAVKHLRNVLTNPFPIKVKIHATAHLLNALIFIAVFLVSISSIPIWLGFQMEWIPWTYFKYAGGFLFSFVIIAFVYFVANLSLLDFSWKGIWRFVWELPLFLSVSMGLALHNGQAVWEGITGKKSPFIRTPKYNLSDSGRIWTQNSYNQFKVPATTYIEAILALVFSLIVLASIHYGTYQMVVFHLMLALGYGLVSWYSFKSYRKAKV
ncbi:MAG: glycosyltransferase [Mongoliibacter sp.]|uniref:cellulose synthase family protein n=1 Tax=Mongoliibacter sp. TaxID=2022438 RepID=UPI0012F2A221|nr:cellulose synthase family protein [Mongoliibacter sp.]TVP44832.1 MAG: glycosyltransferase [Mongoliibacter sp.]